MMLTSLASPHRIRSGTARWVKHATACLVPLVMLVGSQATAQQPMRFGDGTLDVTTEFPEEIRAGEQFEYRIMVRNATDNLTLHDVKLQQTKAEGFTVESVSRDEKASGNQQSPGQSSKQSEQKDDSGKSEKNNDEKQQKSRKTSSGHTFHVKSLEPGQSTTILVKAAADEEGELKTCLQISSYRPSLCMTSKVVKPELEIVKTAPTEANRCDEFIIEYSVKNGGSGSLGAFMVEDDLGKHAISIEGNDKLSFEVDGLKAGEVRRFQARVYATEPGEMTSRAIAKAENIELKSRSKKTTTKIIAPSLMVDINGPNTIYNDANAKFTASVTNHGNATAKNVQVVAMWPKQASLADLTEPQMKKAEGQATAPSSDESKQPTPADNSSQDDGSSSKDKQNSHNSSNSRSANGDKDSNESAAPEMRQQTFTIASLEPNQTAQFDLVVQPRDLDKVTAKVQASYVCKVDSAQDQDQATADTQTTAMTTAQVKRLPALQVYTIDNSDPVQSGSEVTYIVRVLNEGESEDTNIRLTAMLPDQLKFKRADGPTDPQVNGSDIRFKPIDSLSAGDEVEYRLVTTTSGEGDVRFEVELESDSLSNAVTSEEPTRLYGQQN